MKNLRGIFLIGLSFVVLTAVSCRGPQESAQVSNLAVSREVTADNRAISPTDIISASSPKIFLSGRVTNPTKNTRVRVVWLKLPNLVVATEDFAGTKSGTQVFDFDKSSASSYFASSVERPGLAWAEGEYKAEVYLGSRLSQTLFFKIVSDSEAEEQNNRKVISRVLFGSTAANGELEDPSTTFDRNDSHIYIQLELAGRQPGVKIEASVRYLRENRVINTFTATTGEADSLLFDLPLERYGRLWSDRLWAEGAYQVDIRVDGVNVLTPSFVVG